MSKISKETFKIKPTFRDLIVPLSEEEFSGLEKDILYYGCTDPLIVWDGWLLDGHHRYLICTKNNVGFNIHEITNIEDDLGAMRWIINRQLKKRNLDPEKRLEYAFKDYELAQEEAANRKKSTQFKPSNHLEQTCDDHADSKGMVSADLRSPQVLENDKGKAIKLVAKAAGIGTRKAEMYKKIRDASPELKEAILNKGMSVDKAYKQLRKKEHNENLKTKEWPSGKFRVIYTDNPWQYGDKRPPNHGGAEEHYNTMSISELCNLPVADIADENAVLFMWVTSPLLEDSFKVINAWGFEYKTSFVWDKVKHNMGHYNSVRHEFLLIATKGSCVPDNAKLFDSVQVIERTDKHSEKPEEFRKIINTLYQWGGRIELFARKKVEGWEAWGNQV